MTATLTTFPLLSFPSRPAAEGALAAALEAGVRDAHAQGRRARIALSGGSSPEPAYRAFAAKDLDWSKVDIALVDDRWVDVDQAGSNQAMIERAFASATGVTIFGMKLPTASPKQAEAELDDVYRALRPFDAVVLGMGPDAHTASWFPASPDLAACLDSQSPATVLGVDASLAPVAAPYPERMTVTLPVVSEAQQILILLFGADKKQILQQALEAPVTNAPIKAVIEATGARCVALWAE
ncbi:6-phosphogluconolactonase [Aquidulcibacter sp.]|uniref:6-phosphogluconolactonase n=1 Tax=Aquidulcibacter sp. TaxID=2052990 RepID=UPI0025B9D055|nr:6-phosphogluconolactonase [Aquidulcibacter sp.]MCA3697370.1 6-phosphogluconolactonase [Aquidulcibacter sp.]